MNSSEKQHIMASEAQRLIGVSLAKIAQSRVSRGGVSLHKNLLVATVLQKARYVFMEEAYNIVHGHYPHQQSRQIAAIQRHHHHHQQQQQLQLHYHQQQQERAKYANNHHQQQLQQQHHAHQPQYHHHQHSHRESSAAAKSSMTKQIIHQHQQQLHAATAYRHHRASANESDLDVFEHTGGESLSANANDASSSASSDYADKENISPPESSATEPTPAADQLTYLDLDTHNKLNRATNTENLLKRRRVISESETNEAILSILPKRSRTDDEDDSVFIDNVTTTTTDQCASSSSMPLPSSVQHITQQSSQLKMSADHCTTAIAANTALSLNPATVDEPMDANEEEAATDLSATYSEPMEIDRISSLVSIFNFGSLARSSPNTADTCSTQANNHQQDDGSGNPSTSLHHQHSMVAMSV